MIGRAQERVLAVSPFVTSYGAKLLVRECRAGEVLLLTAPSGQALLTGGLEVAALRHVLARAGGAKIRGLRGLHAKVYVADGRQALVTSANLTEPGLRSNYEYGVLISDAAVVSGIERDLNAYWHLGFAVTNEILDAVEGQVQAVWESMSRGRGGEARMRAAARRVDDERIRARIRDSSVNAILSETVLGLLRLRGPLSTQDLHPLVQELHPEICDGSVDRVIDGQRFGKLWKHMVRNAQQWLKARGDIVLEAGRWRAATTR